LLLGCLGFANLDGSRALRDKGILDQLWQVVYGEDNGGVSRGTAKLVAQGLIDLP